MAEGLDLVLAMNTASAERRWEEFEACFTADLRAWSPAYELEGREAFSAAIRQQNEAFDDIRIDTRVVTEQASTVVTEWDWSVPHPSGQGRVVLRGASIHEFREGRICCIRQYWDNTGFVAALTAERGA